MHFSIPDTLEVKNDSSSSYIAYNVHVNGAFHCTVRYRQLYNLYDQLRREFGPNTLPPFPPKKFLPLTPAQVEERRVNLEKFIQLVSQNATVANSDIFMGFLLSAQQETQNAVDEIISLDVHLMNWQKVTVRISSLARTSTVMEVVSKSLKLEEKYMVYFSIFLISKSNNELSVERRLQDFESAYLSLKSAGNDHFLVIRKSYWDSSYDDELIDDKICLNLLYLQAVSDVERGWTKTDSESRRKLVALQARGSKKEYLQLAKTMKYYGNIRFRRCVCDYPQPSSQVTVSAGGRDLIFLLDADPASENKACFRVTRIKCWRITTSLSDSEDTKSLPVKLKLELSFEYLMSKDSLRWICINSDQAIMMSMCLQGMVDELLSKRNGIKVEEKSDRSGRRGSWNYMKRDGSSHQISSSVGRSVSTDGIVHCTNRDDTNNIIGRSKDQVRKITGKFSSKHGIKNGPSSPKPLVENDAFEGIGDDDL
ncbi:sorting nexin-17 [Parasteatoda tepidariorum]|uniref:sorting nexin-17 n=1 Tax=Parasteatoda tepidariorum TaxID=114398 RepID=UPI001C7225F1|nr:sorting nexin-17 [Parasteatoda tepidariorum]